MMADKAQTHKTSTDKQTPDRGEGTKRQERAAAAAADAAPDKSATNVDRARES